jgi:hypothetical protein
MGNMDASVTISSSLSSHLCISIPDHFKSSRQPSGFNIDILFATSLKTLTTPCVHSSASDKPLLFGLALEQMLPFFHSHLCGHRGEAKYAPRPGDDDEHL